MGKFDGCLLASDIDGTLLENGYINPRNIEKIEYFVNEGGKFCLCTGRSIGAIDPVLKAIDKVSYSVVANGCMIYDHTEKKIMYQELLPESDRTVVKTVYSHLPTVGIEIHTECDVFTLRRTQVSDIHQQYEGLPTSVLDFDRALGYNWNKVLFALEKEEQYDEIRGLTDRITENSTLMMTSAVIGGEKQNYFEQLPKGVSKITGLKRLCETVGVKKGGLFAIGDYYNDLEMIKNADIGAATAEAPTDIQQSADFVTGKCKDGAVADFIDYLNENI